MPYLPAEKNLGIRVKEEIRYYCHKGVVKTYGYFCTELSYVQAWKQYKQVNVLNMYSSYN